MPFFRPKYSFSINLQLQYKDLENPSVDDLDRYANHPHTLAINRETYLSYSIFSVGDTIRLLELSKAIRYAIPTF